MEYRKVQQIAKKTIDYIKTEIKVGMPLCVVREKCERKMFSLGADSFWYWNIGAFVFSGDETAVSVSGKNYKTFEKMFPASIGGGIYLFLSAGVIISR